MIRTIGLAGTLVAALAMDKATCQSPDALAKTYAAAIQKLNEEHAKAPGKTTEPELAARLPKPARDAVEKLLKAKSSAELGDPLARAAEAALDLDLIADFDRLVTKLTAFDAAKAAPLGLAVSRQRFQVRGLKGLDRDYLTRFADLLDQILDGYDAVFGFAEWSKVPGKKLRCRVHLEAKITRPPHFAPQFPFHSEVDFPVTDPKVFRSPTQDGQFLFYGLCHELGHVIAMWGDSANEEDRHQWAHYTGVAIVEHLSKQQKPSAFLESSRDVAWRSLELERKRLATQEPSLADKDGALALLLVLHERIGPKQIGAAINELDRKDQRLRLNKVRYYSFRELKQALVELTKDPRDKKWLAELLP